jgi:iduronate 2-sulfatase
MKRFFAAVLAMLACVSGARLDAAEQRNVLFIAIDDLRPELACYGHGTVKSPNIDRLASRGLLFERAYCQQSVCGATRFSLMTGLRPDTTGVYGNQQPLRKTMPDVLSLPQYFRQHGYETVSLGKIYHHASDDNHIGWTGEAWRPKGDWTGRGYLAPESIQRILPPEKANGFTGVGPAYESADVPDDAYPDGQTAKKAVEELRRLKQADKPFFLAMGLVRPHLPFNAPQRYWDLYDRPHIQVPERDAWPQGMPSLARTNWGELRKYSGMPRSGRMPEEEAVNLIHGYYASVSYADALIGKVINELDRLELRDQTVIILWGDHGWKLGDYGAWCKHTNFELDTHVPLILAVPDQATAGQRTAALVEFVDIFPTLADACALKVPATCEGTSMMPLVADPARPWKKAALSQYPRGKTMGYSIRSGKWRYTEWIDRQSGRIVDRELYDQSTGPVAARNLVDEPELVDTVKRLSTTLDRGQGWRNVKEQLPP